MRRRATFIHEATTDVDPKRIQVSSNRFQLKDLKAAREERLTFAIAELPADLRAVLERSYELRIRWSSEKFYDTIPPYPSRTSPGLHVFYTPLKQPDDTGLCSALQAVFSEDLQCDPLSETFIRPPPVSEAWGPQTAFQFYALYPSLKPVVTYIQRNICPKSDRSCLHSVALLNIADTFDIDFDAISQSITISAFWFKPPSVYFDPTSQTTTYNAWDVDIASNPHDKVEVGILSAGDTQEPSDIQLSGFLTVIGEHDHPRATMFSFPSRHHSLIPSQSRSQRYKFSFRKPSGLHPTMQITFSSAPDLTWPENRPKDSTCSLQTYMTFPSYLFMDEYAYLGNDHLFQDTHNVRLLHSLAGEKDLEAPDYVLSHWGSTPHLSLASPDYKYPSADKQSGLNSAPLGNWNVTFPVHLRYMTPTAGGNIPVEIPWPVVFWACQLPETENKPNFNGNPFDRIHLGYEAKYGQNTVFYHLQPDSGSMQTTASSGHRTVETLNVPVINSDLVSSRTIELGTTIFVIAGFLWVMVKLIPGLSKQVKAEVNGPDPRTEKKKQ